MEPTQPNTNSQQITDHSITSSTGNVPKTSSQQAPADGLKKSRSLQAHPTSSRRVGTPIKAKELTPQEDELFEAAQTGDIQKMQSLIDAKIDVNTKDSMGLTALMFAALQGHTSAVQLLLDAHAHVDAKDNNGWTPLMHTANKGHKDVATALIKAGANINSTSHCGRWTAIALASARNRTQSLEMLLAIVMDPRTSKDQAQPSHHDSFLHAARYGDAEVVRKILRAKPGLLDQLGATALREALEHQKHEIVDVLLSYGVSPIAILKESIIKQHTSVTDTLIQSIKSLENGRAKTQIFKDAFSSPVVLQPLIQADLQNPITMGDALISAAEKGHIHAVELCLGAPNLPREDLISTLNTAAYNGHHDALSMIIQSVNDITQEEKGKALLSATIRGHLPAVRQLFPLSDPANQINALASAAEEGHCEVTHFLLSRNLDIQSARMQEALKTAADGHHMEIVSLLLKAGIKLKKRIWDHVFGQATSANRTDILLLLKESGAGPDDLYDRAVDLATAGDLEGVMQCIRILPPKEREAAVADCLDAFQSEGHFDAFDALFADDVLKQTANDQRQDHLVQRPDGLISDDADSNPAVLSETSASETDSAL